MPNKRKFAKLREKMLISGQLNDDKAVQAARRYMAQKAEMDNEDINFDFDVDKNKDLERLEDADDDEKRQKTKTARPSRMTKGPKTALAAAASNGRAAAPMLKLDEQASDANKKQPQSVTASAIPKKSRKNKYFLMAHPELAEGSNGEANGNKVEKATKKMNKEKRLKEKEAKVEKIKKELKAKKANAKEKTQAASKGKAKKVSKQVWTIEECESSDEGEEDKASKPAKKQKTTRGQVLDLTDIDKCFKLEKRLEKQPDGSFIETLVPRFVNADNDDDENLREENEQPDEQEEDGDDDDESGGEKELQKDEEQQKPVTPAKAASPKSKIDLLKEKLESSRFRHLNELLYTQTSDKSYEYFQNDEDAFKCYHAGFRNQVSKWPFNPLDNIIHYVKSKAKNLVVADFGCGEARLAQSVPNKVHSFDLIALNKHVTQCDMKNVNLPNDSCDFAVFCLSLMGTNVVEFVTEAHRILKNKGVLKIAEVTSRIEDCSAFIKNIEMIGFKLVSKKDDPKEYFYFFDFVKVTETINPNKLKKVDIKLKPCWYKKR